MVTVVEGTATDSDPSGHPTFPPWGIRVSLVSRFLRKILSLIYPFHAYSFSEDGRVFRFREKRLVWGIVLVGAGLLFAEDIRTGSERVNAPDSLAWLAVLVLLGMGLWLLIQDRLVLDGRNGLFRFGSSFLGIPFLGRKGRLEDIQRVELVYDLFRSTADTGDSYCYRYFLHLAEASPMRFDLYNIDREEACRVAQGVSDLLGCPWEYREYIR